MHPRTFRAQDIHQQRNVFKTIDLGYHVQQFASPDLPTLSTTLWTYQVLFLKPRVVEHRRKLGFDLSGKHNHLTYDRHHRAAIPSPFHNRLFVHVSISVDHTYRFASA